MCLLLVSLPQQTPVSKSSIAIDDLPQKGDVLGGKYVIESLLGTGGMGVVYGAMDRDLAQPVAIKLLLPEVAKEPQMIARFLREAQAAAAIQNDHVVRVFGVGKTNGGLPFMVMEFLAGVGLDQVILARGPLPVADAVDLVAEACRALAHAHALGIVHRDIKPSNLFLCTFPDGSQRIKVLDFGISKVLTSAEGVAGQHDLTSTVQVLGTPVYMSPEQARSTKSVDVATDIWALGVVLYEILCGATPFAADTLPAVIARIVADNPVRPSERRPDIPEPLEQLIMQCLEKVPSRRPGSISDVAFGLRPFASARGAAHIDVVCRNLDPGSLPTSVQLDMMSLAPAAQGMRVSPARGRRQLAAVVGVSALLASFVSFGIWLRLGPAEPPVPTTSDSGFAEAGTPGSVVREPAPVGSTSASEPVASDVPPPPPIQSARAQPSSPSTGRSPASSSDSSSAPPVLDPYDRY